MAFDSQVDYVAAVSDMPGLVHEIFTNFVENQVRANSPLSQLFQAARMRADYRLEGTNLVGAADLTYSGGGIGTGGSLPRHQQINPQNWKATAVRLYLRRAIDNFSEAKATGKGAFQDLFSRIFDQQWDAWSRMNIRHAVGGSTGFLCLVASRSSATVVVVDSGYGHAGTHPGMHLEPGMDIAWLDASNSYNVGGAGTIASIDHDTGTDGQAEITLESAWDDGSTVPADGDPIVFCTTPDTTEDYFDTEYTNAPHGVTSLIDPDDALTTVLNINEDTYTRWRPYRQPSSTFDHIELTEHWQKLRVKSTFPVNASTHTVLSAGGPLAELARTLEGYQRQFQLGRTFEGGYTALRVAGMDFVQDDYWLHDVILTLCTEALYRANLDGEADVWAEDGSQFSRLADYDGKEWFVSHYMQQWTTQRNRHGVLTGITLSNVTGDEYAPVPNY